MVTKNHKKKSPKLKPIGRGKKRVRIIRKDGVEQSYQVGGKKLKKRTILGTCPLCKEPVYLRHKIKRDFFRNIKKIPLWTEIAYKYYHIECGELKKRGIHTLTNTESGIEAKASIPYIKGLKAKVYSRKRGCSYR
ncbi:MAG: hypothetical protein KAR87_06205 [Candidatus Aenigmarchaeota archaeon]|nr:hypothetical protein [Candidatus Aenigmarchaeota archaeon]